MIDYFVESRPSGLGCLWCKNVCYAGSGKNSGCCTENIYTLFGCHINKGDDLANKSSENNLYDFIEHQLPIFDEILANNQKPLSQRPLAAAFYFVDYCIVESK